MSSRARYIIKYEGVYIYLGSHLGFMPGHNDKMRPPQLMFLSNKLQKSINILYAKIKQLY